MKTNAPTRTADMTALVLLAAPLLQGPPSIRFSVPAVTCTLYLQNCQPIVDNGDAWANEHIEVRESGSSEYSTGRGRPSFEV